MKFLGIELKPATPKVSFHWSEDELVPFAWENLLPANYCQAFGFEDVEVLEDDELAKG